ncbi:lytic transglycosylase domain-containing protein [Ampullimonas aquatilis]|uniref:lytic transglycosylase domain-containing protein n=1 Tax=Ampullimonas aquatilis TaxID=1341549 RepID=UPI003C73DF10
MFADMPYCAAYDRIYAFEDEAGVTNLSNVPEDQRYKILIDRRAIEVVKPIGSTRSAYKVGVADVKKIQSVIQNTSQLVGLPSPLVEAVVSVESAFDQYAISRKGAKGLMQLMPTLAAQYGVVDAFDMHSNIMAGSRHLKYLLAQFDGDKRLALAAYNAGINAVYKHNKAVPPYPETMNYVEQVLLKERLLSALRTSALPITSSSIYH